MSKIYFLFAALALLMSGCTADPVGDDDVPTTPPKYVSPLEDVSCATNEILYITTDASDIDVTIPGNKIISHRIVDGIFRIVFESDITEIPSICFLYNEKLQHIKLPSGVTSIEYGAFYGCGNLISAIIPDSVTEIGEQAFILCVNLQGITIPDGVRSIYYGTFYQCSSLTSITIPDSVQVIEEQAFAACSSLENVTIGNGVQSIKEQAFADCVALRSITLPNSLTEVGRGILSNTPSLEGIYGKFASDDNKCLIFNNTLISFAPSGVSEYRIPDGVTTIGECALFGSPELTSLTIPSSVTALEERCVAMCRLLESVTIPETVTDIESGAFFACSSLRAFYGKFATLDNRSLIVNGELVGIAPAGMLQFFIPGGTTKVGDYVFASCSNLTDITIPGGVQSIGFQAFASCQGLTNIAIPSGVVSIGNYAFRGCTNLSEVYCTPTAPPTIAANTFTNNASNRKFYVPTDSVKDYQSADIWSDYANSICAYNF